MNSSETSQTWQLRDAKEALIRRPVGGIKTYRTPRERSETRREPTGYSIPSIRGESYSRPKISRSTLHKQRERSVGAEI